MTRKLQEEVKARKKAKRIHSGARSLRKIASGKQTYKLPSINSLLKISWSCIPAKDVPSIKEAIELLIKRDKKNVAVGFQSSVRSVTQGHSRVVLLSESLDGEFLRNQVGMLCTARKVKVLSLPITQKEFGRWLNVKSCFVASIKKDVSIFDEYGSSFSSPFVSACKPTQRLSIEERAFLDSDSD